MQIPIWKKKLQISTQRKTGDFPSQVSCLCVVIHFYTSFYLCCRYSSCHKIFLMQLSASVSSLPLKQMVRKPHKLRFFNSSYCFKFAVFWSLVTKMSQSKRLAVWIRYEIGIGVKAFFLTSKLLVTIHITSISKTTACSTSFT